MFQSIRERGKERSIHHNRINDRGGNMNDKLIELGIELEDIAVELNDRAGNDFDELLVKRLNKVIFELQNMEAVWIEKKWLIN